MKILLFIIAALMAAQMTMAEETVIVKNVLGAEGPLYFDGNLYFVGWVSNTLSNWDGKKTTILNNAPNCGHNGLALTKQKTFLLACTDEHGVILVLDLNGKEFRGWDADDKGHKFDGGINGIVVTGNVCAYAPVTGH